MKIISLISIFVQLMNVSLCLHISSNHGNIHSALDNKKNYNIFESREHVIRKRYLGLGKKFKLNRRYQECIAQGDVKGHCKHQAYCPNQIFNEQIGLEYLCIIEKAHVGVCCPDDIASSNVVGSHLVVDLPAGGNDYDENDSVTGCGVPSNQRSLTSTDKRQIWPWLAALYRPQQLESEQQFCGGSLITDTHVLSASHCFTHETQAKDIRVRLGEYDFSRPNESRSLDYAVAAIITHQDFALATYENDIAIVRLEKPTTFNSYIWPICLPGYGESYVGRTVLVAGWGQQYVGGPTSEVLLQVAVPVWKREECVEAFVQKITDDMICAAGYEGEKDSCQGDSGGPLMDQLPNGRWVVIGVVSWGIGCGTKGKPGVYTKVGNYLPWIIKNTMVKD